MLGGSGMKYSELRFEVEKIGLHIGMKVTVMESMVRSLNREVSKLYVINPIWECNEEDVQ